jgi:cell division septation protein DedD
VWARRVAVAGACVVAINVVVEGGYQLSTRLNGLLSEAPALPPLPAQPTVATTSLMSPAAAPSESAQVVASGDYLVAVGMFASRERADRLVQELTQAGLPACQQPFELRARPVQQVVLGPFARREDAAESLQRLRQLGGYDDAHVSAVSSNDPPSRCIAVSGAHVASGQTPGHAAARTR